MMYGSYNSEGMVQDPVHRRHQQPLSGPPPPPPPSHHNLMQINGVFKDEPVTLPDPGLIVDMIKADTNDDRLESEEVDHASPNHGGGKARNLNVKLKAKSSAGTAAKQK